MCLQFFVSCWLKNEGGDYEVKTSLCFMQDYTIIVCQWVSDALSGLIGSYEEEVIQFWRLSFLLFVFCPSAFITMCPVKPLVQNAPLICSFIRGFLISASRQPPPHILPFHLFLISCVQRKSNRAKEKKARRLEERAAMDAVCAKVEAANKVIWLTSGTSRGIWENGSNLFKKRNLKRKQEEMSASFWPITCQWVHIMDLTLAPRLTAADMN